MKRSRIFVNESQKKKLGRPRSVSAEGLAPAVAVRLPLAVLSQVDNWSAKTSLTRSEAIRRLVEHGLAAELPAPTKPPHTPAKRRKDETR
jgi:hypothetical protein